MQKITNNSKAPQGLHTKSGVVFIHPGKSRDLDLSEEGLKFAKRLPFLTVDEIDAPEAIDPLDHDGDGEKGGSDPEGEVDAALEKLRADAKALGIKVHWKHSAETIQAAIDAKLAE